MGWAYFYKEELDKAAAYFERALEIEPESALINADVGAFLGSIGLFPSANKFHTKVRQLEQSYLRGFELGASCYWYLGEFEQGLEWITKAIELEKNDPSLYLEHARYLIMMKEFDRAEEELLKAVSIQPDLPLLAYHQAFLFAAQGEKEKALKLVEGAERPHQYCITCAYSLLGMKDEAIKNIRLGIDVGFEEFQHYLYSYLLLEKNPCFDNLRDDPRFIKILNERKAIHDQRLREVRVLLDID